MSYTVLVKRPYTTKDANGEAVIKNNWPKIGRSNNGSTLFLDHQPLVIDGNVEPIYIKKNEAVSPDA